MLGFVSSCCTKRVFSGIMSLSLNSFEVHSRLDYKQQIIYNSVSCDLHVRSNKVVEFVLRISEYFKYKLLCMVYCSGSQCF
jgi:hypothetical protein